MKAPIATIPSIINCSGSPICRKLLRKHDGDVARALASYNAGPDRVDHALSAGDNWLSRLPAETQDYVQRIASCNI
jgi:soluble lytic murein transglycosylase-like protein